MVDSDFDDTPEESEDFGALTGGGSDSGMGNLPPLSDFDSSKTDSDSEDLPPLDTPDSGMDDDEGGISGLPPIVDIKVDTPAVRPSDLDTPEPKKGSKGSKRDTATPMGFDTPGDLESPDPSQGLGFQDFRCGQRLLARNSGNRTGPGQRHRNPDVRQRVRRG
jgi:hypothetical protein